MTHLLRPTVLKNCMWCMKYCRRSQGKTEYRGNRQKAILDKSGQLISDKVSCIHLHQQCYCHHRFIKEL